MNNDIISSEVENDHFIKSNKRIVLTSGDLQESIQIFVSQLRSLLRLSCNHSSSTIKSVWTDKVDNFEIGVRFLPSAKFGITEWELDIAMRNRIRRYVIDAISTLHSLTTLIQRMTHMVIRDSVSVNSKNSLNHLLNVRKIFKVYLIRFYLHVN